MGHVSNVPYTPLYLAVQITYNHVVIIPEIHHWPTDSWRFQSYKIQLILGKIN